MMKKLILLILVTGLILTSCKKDDDSNEPANVVNNGKVKIGTIEYPMNNLYWEQNGDDYEIYPISFSGNLLTIEISPKKTGQIELNEDNTIDFEIGDDYYNQVSGTMNITKFDASIIQGTFTGKFTKNDDATEIDVTGSFVAKKLSYLM